MSVFLFIMVIDWIMSKTTKGNNFRFRWNFTSKLDDLDYLDYIALLSSSKHHIQRKPEILDTISQSTGLIINSAKTKVIRMNNTNEHTITINGSDIKEVDTFIYLGEIVSKEVGTGTEIRRRLGHAREAYNKLKNMVKQPTLKENQTKDLQVNRHICSVVWVRNFENEYRRWKNT